MGSGGQSTIMGVRKKYIGILAIVYMVCCVVIYYCVPGYIEQKKEKSRSDAYYNIYEMSKYNDKYIDIEYHNYNNFYKQIPIPEIEEPSINDITKRIGLEAYLTTGGEEAAAQIRKEREISWIKKYGDAKEVFIVGVYPDGPDFLRKYGWALKIIEYKKNSSYEVDGYMEYYLIPTQVILKNGYNWAGINVDMALERALDYITTEDRDLKDFYKKGTIIDFKDEIKRRINNEFYNISQDEQSRIKFLKENDPLGLSTDDNEVTPYTSIGNSYYEVYLSRTQPKTYSLKLIDEEDIENKIRDLRLKGIIYASIILIILIGIILIMYRKNEI